MKQDILFCIVMGIIGIIIAYLFLSPEVAVVFGYVLGVFGGLIIAGRLEV